MNGGSDSTSILDRALVLVPLPVLEAAYTTDSCVSNLACSSHTLYTFSSLIFSHQTFEANIKTHELSDKFYTLA